MVWGDLGSSETIYLTEEFLRILQPHENTGLKKDKDQNEWLSSHVCSFPLNPDTQSLLVSQNLHTSWMNAVCHSRSWIRFLEHKDGPQAKKTSLAPLALGLHLHVEKPPFPPSPGIWSWPLRSYTSNDTKKYGRPTTRGWEPVTPNPVA